MSQAGKLDAIIEPAVAALGYELVGVEFLPQGRHSVLRVYIDSEAGIRVEDCERVSHQISGVLEVEDPISGQYTLEVSSPGLDRPLFKAEHYQRFAGSEVKLRLIRPLDGQRKFRGVLHGMREDAVVIEVEGQEITLPLADIEKANLVPKW